jgi:di/tripeptidase
MRAVVERFTSQPLAYIIVEGMGLGEIFHRGLAVQRYRISVQTQGGHAWINYGKPSANHELGCLVSRLVNIPVPRQPRSSLNVGVMRGGTSINTIAAHAELELDLRSTQAEGIHYLSREVERLVRETNHQGVSCTAEVIGQRPGGEVPKEHPLVRLAISVLNELDVRPEPGIGSTDANVPISLGYPAICIALTSGNGAHTHTEFIRTEPLPKGLEQLYRIVTRAWTMK